MPRWRPCRLAVSELCPVCPTPPLPPPPHPPVSSSFKQQEEDLLRRVRDLQGCLEDANARCADRDARIMDLAADLESAARSRRDLEDGLVAAGARAEALAREAAAQADAAAALGAQLADSRAAGDAAAASAAEARLKVVDVTDALGSLRWVPPAVRLVAAACVC